MYIRTCARQNCLVPSEGGDRFKLLTSLFHCNRPCQNWIILTQDSLIHNMYTTKYRYSTVRSTVCTIPCVLCGWHVEAYIRLKTKAQADVLILYRASTCQPPPRGESSAVIFFQYYLFTEAIGQKIETEHSYPRWIKHQYSTTTVFTRLCVRHKSNVGGQYSVLERE